MYVQAKCYLQAGCDAEAAVRHFESVARALSPGRHDPDALSVTHIHQPGTMSPFRRARVDPLAWAWCARGAILHLCWASPSHLRRFVRGEAFAAESGHPSQDWGAAASCFVRALDLDPQNPLYAQHLADAATELNGAQLSSVLDAVYMTRSSSNGLAAAALGVADAAAGAFHRCMLSLCFPTARTEVTVGARACAEACRRPPLRPLMQ
jgi:hypothetical protein